MIEETTAGPASSMAWHWAAKSGGVESPEVCGTSGPHWPRKARTRASWSASRAGGGSGIQRLIWKAPLEPWRTSRAQSVIASGRLSTPPMPPMPPARPTAMARLAGQAPAIGACSMGILSANRRQKASAR